MKQGYLGGAQSRGCTPKGAGMGMWLEYLLDNSQVKCFRHDKMGRSECKPRNGWKYYVSSYVVSLEMPWFPPRGTERGGEILIGTYTNI